MIFTVWPSNRRVTAALPIRLKLDITSSTKLDAIYGTLSEQLEAIQMFEKIDDTRNLMKQNILPGSL